MERVEKLYELANHDPIVHKCLTHYRRGDCSFEDALIEAVLALAQLQKETQEQLIDQSMNCGYNPFDGLDVSFIFPCEEK